MTDHTAPAVTVIMPTYNRAHLMPASIASVLEQDYRDLELLVIDDGSTDETPQLIVELQARDDRLRYLSLPENRGIGYARVTGVQNALGRYIGFSDSDDRWLPGKLERQVDIMERYPQVDLLFGDFWNIDTTTGERTRAFERTQPGLDLLEVSPLGPGLWQVECGMEHALLVKMFIQLGTVIMRSRVIERVGNFRPDLSGPEDFEFCWRAAVRGAQFAFMEKTTVERSINPSSITFNQPISWSRYLGALQVCRDTAQRSARMDLLEPLNRAEQRAYRNLVWSYGMRSDRANALKSYRESLHLGYSLKGLLFLVTALIGPTAISLSKRLLSYPGRGFSRAQV